MPSTTLLGCDSYGARMLADHVFEAVVMQLMCITTALDRHKHVFAGRCAMFVPVRLGPPNSSAALNEICAVLGISVTNSTLPTGRLWEFHGRVA
jgi:hypothetical protein